METKEASDIKQIKERADAALSIFANVFSMIPDEDLAELIAAIDRQDAIQPLLDPTGYIQVRRHIPTAREVYSKMLDLRRAIEKAHAETEAAL